MLNVTSDKETRTEIQNSVTYANKNSRKSLMRMKISVGSEIIVVLQGSFRGATHSI